MVKETDLLIHAQRPLESLAKELTLTCRDYIEAYLRDHPGFAETLTPWPQEMHLPNILNDMLKAGEQAGVGPMAGVAGAIAEYVGQGILSHPRGSEEVIVENGGDIFLKTATPAKVAIFAGKSPVSMKFGLRIDTIKEPLAVCTSSGTVGHSLSLGRADAVCVVSQYGALADAAATSVGNRVKSRADIQGAINFGKKISGIKGLVIVKDDQMALWGALDVIPLAGKKG